MENNNYKIIYEGHKRVMNEIIKRCPHRPTVDLLKKQIGSDEWLLSVEEECDKQPHN
jgi:hypothetical protein